VSADVGSFVRVVVTASNAAGSSSAQSVAVGPVAAAAPVTVSFAVTASGDDGDVGVRAPLTGGWPPSGTASPYTTGAFFTVGKRNVFSQYQIFDGLMRFNTASLPDNAQISSATLTITAVGKGSADGRSLIGSWIDGSANWPISASDWVADAGTTALAGTALSSIPVGSQTTINLTGVGQISLTGYTGLRLGLSGAAPTGDNYLQITAADSSPAAVLTVTYTTP
jgi:hypothetical protein